MRHLVGFGSVTMHYGLGIDLGTTKTAAAVHVDGRVEVVRLGGRRAEIPSLIFVTAGGGLLFGEPAERRGQTEPGRLARGFTRRIGDPGPILAGGVPFSAHALTGKLLRHVADTVTGLRGGAPAAITVTHPAGWGPDRLERLDQAITIADVGDVRLRSEPEAAARQHAAARRIAPGGTVAVYDLGGGTFDVAVLRREGDGFLLLGEPDGGEQLAGADFDEAVLGHVMGVLGPAAEGLDPADDEVAAGLTRLRRDCADAKEALSFDTETTIDVALPGLHTRVRLDRSDLESLIAPALADTVAATHRALRAAGVAPADLGAVLLAGGSSRIPLVTRLLSAEFAAPVVPDPHPEHGVAMGAALATAGSAPAAPPTPAAPPAPAPARPLLFEPTPVPGALPALGPAQHEIATQHEIVTRGDAASRGEAATRGEVATRAGRAARTEVATQDGTTTQDERATQDELATRDETAPAGEDATRALAAPGAAPPPAVFFPGAVTEAAGDPAGAEPTSPLGAAPAPRSRPLLVLVGTLAALLLAGTVTAVLLLVNGRDADQPATAAQPSAAAPPPFPTDTMLVRVDTGTADDRRSKVFLLKPGSDERTPLPGSEAGDVLPKWSHDRQQIALTHTGADGTPALYVMNADGSDRHVVVENGGGRPAWSADGKKIGFVRKVDGVPQLFTVTLATGELTQLTHSPDVKDDPVWTPDGKSIIYWVALDGGIKRIYELTVADPREPGRAITGPDAGSANDPAPSPDGTRVLYTRETGTGAATTYDIWSIGIDGRDPRRVTADPRREMDPTWSPDGKWFAFIRGDLAHPQVVIARADGSDERTLTRGTAREGHPCWY